MGKDCQSIEQSNEFCLMSDSDGINLIRILLPIINIRINNKSVPKITAQVILGICQKERKKKSY